MPAVCEGNGVSPVYDVTATREKGRHLAVSYVVRVPIEGLTDQEQRSRVWMRLPTRPRSIALAEAFAESKHLHQCPVKGQGPIEILYAYKDVGEHASDPYPFSTALGPWDLHSILCRRCELPTQKSGGIAAEDCGAVGVTQAGHVGEQGVDVV